ncbi:hsp70 family protein [Anaeramoeba flamelloides]|uniref:Hsp70 family protein n=1 Tax=Anaeramoeba flamelloides TaxID=1746091 RepID=A0ABQ8ZCT2_9EUKA|nr:hsp70 family protein [Anaeramoeba flamelloides]
MKDRFSNFGKSSSESDTSFTHSSTDDSSSPNSDSNSSSSSDSNASSSSDSSSDPRSSSNSSSSSYSYSSSSSDSSSSPNSHSSSDTRSSSSSDSRSSSRSSSSSISSSSPNSHSSSDTRSRSSSDSRSSSISSSSSNSHSSSDSSSDPRSSSEPIQDPVTQKRNEQIQKKYDTYGLYTKSRDLHKISQFRHVIAIDFGTSETGVMYGAFGNLDSKNFLTFGNRNSKNNIKVPTSILFEKNGDKLTSIIGFGPSAIDRYYKWLEKGSSGNGNQNNNSEELELFTNIKMQIYNNENIQRIVKSVSGKFYHLFLVLRGIFIWLKELTLLKMVEQNSKEKLMSINWVITIPSVCDEKKWSEIKNAAIGAGLEDKKREYKVSIIFEPEAAGIRVLSDWYDGVKTKNLEKKKLVVVDGGGGTIDVSYLKFKKKKRKKTSHRKEGSSVWDNYVLQLEASPEGTKYGSKKIDNYFKKFFAEFIGAKTFPSENDVNVVKIVKEWETKKKSFQFDQTNFSSEDYTYFRSILEYFPEGEKSLHVLETKVGEWNDKAESSIKKKYNKWYQTNKESFTNHKPKIQNLLKIKKSQLGIHNSLINLFFYLTIIKFKTFFNEFLTQNVIITKKQTSANNSSNRGGNQKQDKKGKKRKRRNGKKKRKEFKNVSKIKDNLHSVVLVGGLSKSELFQNAIQKMVKNISEDILVTKFANPQNAILEGAFHYGCKPEILESRKYKDNICIKVDQMDKKTKSKYRFYCPIYKSSNDVKNNVMIIKTVGIDIKKFKKKDHFQFSLYKSTFNFPQLCEDYKKHYKKTAKVITLKKIDVNKLHLSKTEKDEGIIEFGIIFDYHNLEMKLELIRKNTNKEKGDVNEIFECKTEQLHYYEKKISIQKTIKKNTEIEKKNTEIEKDFEKNDKQKEKVEKKKKKENQKTDKKEKDFEKNDNNKKKKNKKKSLGKKKKKKKNGKKK